MNNELSVYHLVHRSPWGLGFPDVWIHAQELAVKKDSNYLAAKSGDPLAAAQLIHKHLNPDLVEEVGAAYTKTHPVLVSVHAEEALGRNAIPEMMAERMSEML